MEALREGFSETFPEPGVSDRLTGSMFDLKNNINLSDVEVSQEPGHRV